MSARERAHREDQVLGAIAGAPHDHALRLVYADWLEEQGDARSQIIRLTEERRSLDPYSNRAWELRSTLRELEQQPSAWLEQMGYLTYRPLFQRVAESWRDRWRLVVEFIESWWGVAMVAESGLDEAQIAGVRVTLGRLERFSPATAAC